MGRANPALLDPARYPHRTEITTRYADMDPNRHINNVALAAMFEDSRVRFGEASGSHAQSGTAMLMIAAVNIDYLAQAYHPAPIVIHAGVLAIGRSSWQVAQLALQDGRPCAFCQTADVATDGVRAIPLSDDLRAALAGWMLRPEREPVR